MPSRETLFIAFAQIPRKITLDNIVGAGNKYSVDEIGVKGMDVNFGLPCSGEGHEYKEHLHVRVAVGTLLVRWQDREVIEKEYFSCK